METCDGAGCAAFFDAHVGTEIVMPGAELFEDAVDLMDVETVRSFGYTVDVRH